MARHRRSVFLRGDLVEVRIELVHALNSGRGLVAVGLNDVVRIYKYVQGNVFGRHIDQTVQRADGKVSRYSLRIYLNGSDGEFEGGGSIFHIPFRADPVVFEPETGLALIYPQGDQCTVQEEA